MRQYRLKMVQVDGAFRYSDRLSLAGGQSLDTGDFSMYPNPATDQLNLAVSSPSAAHLSLRISALDGRALPLRTWEVPEGASRVSTSLKELPAGVYIYQVTLGAVRRNGVLVKE
jgi:hypothetical protein